MTSRQACRKSEISEEKHNYVISIDIMVIERRKVKH
jgi:hypothetical protein